MVNASARRFRDGHQVSGRHDVYTVGLVDWRGIPMRLLSALVTHDRAQAVRELDRVRDRFPAACLIRRTTWLIVEHG